MLGCIACVALGAVAAWLFLRRRERQRLRAAEDQEEWSAESKKMTSHELVVPTVNHELASPRADPGGGSHEFRPELLGDQREEAGGRPFYELLSP